MPTLLAMLKQHRPVNMFHWRQRPAYADTRCTNQTAEPIRKILIDFEEGVTWLRRHEIAWEIGRWPEVRMVGFSYSSVKSENYLSMRASKVYAVMAKLRQFKDVTARFPTEID